MSLAEPTASRRPRLLSVAMIVALTTLVTACNGTWGIRTSFRSYVAGPAGGQVTTHGGVKWVDAAGPGKGPFEWAVDWSTYDAEAGTGTVQFSGGVTMQAHATGNDHVLDVSVWNPRLEIDGDEGTLVADLAYRPYNGTNPSPLPNLEAALDVEFAAVDLEGRISTTNGESYKISAAPMVGIDAAMDLIGFDEFYGTNVQLDPISANFGSNWAQRLANEPVVTVSRTSGVRPGDQIIVWGTGFDPTAHTGTRPPLSGQHSGIYAVFGNFAANWRPSAGAPSSARKVAFQRWALPAASRALVDPTHTSPDYADLSSTGRFKTIVTVGTTAETPGSYGVYTYPGSGAVNAAQETATLVTLAP